MITVLVLLGAFSGSLLGTVIAVLAVMRFDK